MNKYSEDFGEALNQIANDPEADGPHLWYYLKQLSNLSPVILNGEFTEEEVNLVFEHCGITKDIMMKIVDKFLERLDEKMNEK